jgi:hypothetical protein
VQQLDVGGQLLAALLDLVDARQELSDAGAGGVAVASDLLQAQVQAIDARGELVIFALLLRLILTMLDDGRLELVALGVEQRLGEAIVLIGGVMHAFPLIEILLRLDVLLAVARDLDLPFLDLLVERRQLFLRVGVVARLQLGIDALLLQLVELELEPLPAADVVVEHHPTGDQQQGDAGQSEDEVELPHRVVVRNGLLRLHQFSVRN